MAVTNVEWWKNATPQGKKEYVKESLIKIHNFEKTTKDIIELYSHKSLSEGRELIEVNKECLEYIKKLKESK